MVQTKISTSVLIPEFAGYVGDNGAAYGDRGNGWTYGWIDGTDAPDEQSENRNRNNGDSPDERWDTLNHMIKGDSHRWQIDIPNGTYNVRLVGGDPNHTDQTSDFEISGGDTPHMLADPDGPGNNWDEFNFTYTVTNGFLRVTPNPDGDLSKNQKLSFIDISPVPEPTMFGLASLAALALLGLRRRR